MLRPSLSSNGYIIQLASLKVLLQLDLWFSFKSEVEQHIRQIRAACVELLHSLYCTGGGLIKGNTEVIHQQAVTSFPTADTQTVIILHAKHSEAAALREYQ